MSNRLAKETSPYLQQHKDNPVDWYPWCDEAFERARREDKPVFLSIGYSACHWCHVIAHESFEDAEISDLLNQYFVSIKVDKEERLDIDTVYMAVCQAFTGSGGWPASIFMTPDKKPFFAGTYFPRTSRGGRIGMRELLLALHQQWVTNRDDLVNRADEIIRRIKDTDLSEEIPDIDLTHAAVRQYQRVYDDKHGGFGPAPKFPAPHNLLFLLSFYERFPKTSCLEMVEHTLVQMYRGGLFDHIGFGFCRYSTDDQFLVPHFEKMLYDNALLILAYCEAFTVTKKPLYSRIAEKTATYILKEMTSPEGGFYSSQDADSQGKEGEYYLFTPREILDVLGQERGEGFNQRFDITEKGNFEGKNIPNLLKWEVNDHDSLDQACSLLDSYRKERYTLHRDEKILTAWNGLMIAAMCRLYLATGREEYLAAAKGSDGFIRQYMLEQDTLFVSYHLGKLGVPGFLDDYAAYIFAQLTLYQATLEEEYLDVAKRLSDRVVADFSDKEGGFYMYSDRHEELILRPKETYDGAIPSGNSLMAYNFVRLAHLTHEDTYKREAERQLDFMAREAARYPIGYAMYLQAHLDYTSPPEKITVVLDGQTDKSKLPLSMPAEAAVLLLPHPTKEYPLVNGKTTYYVCRKGTCLPPTNTVIQ